MSSPSSMRFEGVSANAGWSAHKSISGEREVPRTVERKRRGRAVDVVTLPTPPHSRQNNQLPTPETLRQPRKSDLTRRSPHTKQSHHDQTTSFLPTPQTLPRKRAVSPSGQTTFTHSNAVPTSTLVVPRRRPGLTFAQQMGLLTSTTAVASATFGGRLGVGVGMGGGHKAGNHRGVDLIPGRIGKEEENPFYVSPTTRTKGKSQTFRSPQLEENTDDEMSGPSSPLANRLHQSNFASSSTSSAPGPSTPTQHLPLPPSFPSSPTPNRKSPRQLAKAAKLASMMDEDHNPFLARSSDVHVPHPPRMGMDEHDRPYVTYVFRGSKKVFANPFTRPDMPFPPAQLDPEDEDFEEHPCPKPRLLWPTAISKGRRQEEDEEMEVEVTPSPPSSPLMRTPKTGKRARFLNADRSLETGMFDPPTEVYSDSEEERERVNRGTTKTRDRRVRIQESEDEEDPPKVRRGLLFGAGSEGSAAKRVGEDFGRDGKKSKNLRM